MTRAHPHAPGGDKTRLVVASLLLLGAWLSLAQDLGRASQRNDPWIVGDWLINYAGGFVRRGLPGEAILLLWRATGLRPPAWVLGLQLTLYAVFLIAAFRLLRPRLRDPGFLLAAVSPVTFSFWALDPQGAGRKEILYFAILATYAWLLQNDSRLLRSDLRHGVLLSLALTLAVLSHEMLFLFAPFVLVLLVVFKDDDAPRAARMALGTLVAPALAFAMSLVFHGDPATLSRICRSLRRFAPDPCLGYSAIGYLGRSVGDAVRDVGQEIRDHDLIGTYAVALLLGALPFLMIARSLGGAWERWPRLLRSRREARLLVLALVSPLPLFVVGYDWGRFLNVYFVSLLVVSCAWAHRRDARKEAPGSSRGEERPRPRTRALVVLLVLAYATCWSMPHSGGPIGSGFLPKMGRVLTTIEAVLSGLS